MRRRLHVLLVDDDDLVRRALARVVRGCADVDVVEDFGTPVRALRRATTRPRPFDLAVLDLFLGVDAMDGVALAESLRVRVASLPVVFVSGDASPSRPLGARARGLIPAAVAILEKPARVDELCAAIHRASACA